MHNLPPGGSPSPSGSEWITITLNGSQPAVEAMIRLLHQHHILAAGDWSKPTVLKRDRIVICAASRGIRPGI